VSSSSSLRSLHSPAPELFRLVKNGRNDALHQGARVRHLSDTVVRFALVLEDALMNSETVVVRVGDVMVREVTVAEHWHPVAFIRQRMLANAFSFVPIYIEGKWRIISDLALAKYVSNGSNRKRGERLAAQIEIAINEGLRTYDSVQVSADCEVKSVLNKLDHCPALIFDEERLVGIVTAFDLL
jgi:predicted transcriptional regulator